MKNQVFRYFTIIVLVLTFAGCTTFQLRDANEQLTSYYYAKQQATHDADWRMLENVQLSLRTLAADAAEQAPKEKNVLNQIAFYRIATTAAWQAGDLNVVSYADDGSKLCTDENFSRAPRDCSMLLVMPIFAGVDETTERFNELQDEVTSASEGQKAKFAPDAQKVFNDYRTGLATILKLRPKLADSAAHPNFMMAVDQNTGELLCELIAKNGVGLIAAARGDVPKAICEVHDLKKNAFAAGLNKAHASCLPESREQLPQPQDCP